MKYLLAFVISALLMACSAVSTTSTSAPDLPVTGTTISDSLTVSPIDTYSPAEEPPNMQYAPQPKDTGLSRENIFIEEAGLVIRESYPPQISLGISGNLPTPCHRLRAVISKPDVANKINVEVYTVVDPSMICTQVLEPFMENIDLGTFPSGHYFVWVNGELAGEFDS